MRCNASVFVGARSSSYVIALYCDDVRYKCFSSLAWMSSQNLTLPQILSSIKPGNILRKQVKLNNLTHDGCVYLKVNVSESIHFSIARKPDLIRENVSGLFDPILLFRLNKSLKSVKSVKNVYLSSKQIPLCILYHCLHCHCQHAKVFNSTIHLHGGGVWCPC